jgi:DnaJ-class molecular chaperone
MSDILAAPLGSCPVCAGSGKQRQAEVCGFCNGRGQVPTITLSDADFDHIAMQMTGTATVEDAERALRQGCPDGGSVI